MGHYTIFPIDRWGPHSVPCHDYAIHTCQRIKTRRPLLLQREVPGGPLQHQTDSTGSEDCQGPRVGGLLSSGPDAVLGLLVPGKLRPFDGVGLGIALFLRGLVLCVAADVSQESIVGHGAEEDKRVKLAGAPEEERKRDVNESITEVAIRQECQ